MDECGWRILQKRPHVVWMELHQETYLDEMVHWVGRADAIGSNKCPDCIACSSAILGPPEYRCEDCFQPDLTCAKCCVRRHRAHPLHQIEVRIILNDVNGISHGPHF
jgi:hypothetical protein